MFILLREIINVINANATGNHCVDASVMSLLTDSRQLAKPEGTLFFALKTKIRDGHVFIEELYANGVRFFVVDNNYFPDLSLYPNACFLSVQSPIVALQQIAAYIRSNSKIPIIAITGSNGKTIVKEWLFHLISHFANTIRSPKSYNSSIGVPLSVSMLKQENEYAIFEAGISHPNEMQVLQNIIRPDYGIFTNIGPAHDENFKNREQKIKEKLMLFPSVCKLVMCDKHFDIIHTTLNKQILKRSSLFLWGTKSDSNLYILEQEQTNIQTNFKIVFQDKILQFQIPFTDGASAENAMHAFAAMLMLGFDPEKTAKLMKTLPSVAMRLELHNGINNCIVINDSYNSDMHSLSIALDFLKQQQKNKTSCIILSDMLQTGLNSEVLYEQTAILLQNKSIDKLIGIGTNISANAPFFEKIPQKEFYSDTSRFISNVKLSSFQNQIVLVKGARQFAFERIVGLLEQKTHQTVLEVNLNSIHHNLNTFKSILKPGVGVMAMVKAFSYGTGSHEIAGLLEYHHVDYLGVAYADEGVELRKKGIKMPIMVMAPEQSSIDSVVSWNLEPEIYNFESLSWFEKIKDEVIKIHLKFDTGMNRLGFKANDVHKLCKRLKANPHLNVVSVFSHLASSDIAEQRDFTISQFRKFDEMCNLFSKLHGYMPVRHILNSAGILNYGEYCYEMVRLGLGLYGIMPKENKTLSLQQCVKFKTVVIHVEKIQAGEQVGYNAAFIAKNDMQIAVIPVGYADGFRRSLSNRVGSVAIKGQRCDVVGYVCMDMTIIDVTGMNVVHGDTAIIFDEHYTVSDLARDMKVIPYEVITGISQRVKRQYVME